MSADDRKARIREYKQTPMPAGVFVVRNTTTGKSLVGSSTNLPGMLNRQRFQLESGAHPSLELQADFKQLGAGAFEFAVLDALEPSDEPGYDPAEELEVLADMWIAKLTAAGASFYRRAGRGV